VIIFLQISTAALWPKENRSDLRPLPFLLPTHPLVPYPCVVVKFGGIILRLTKGFNRRVRVMELNLRVFGIRFSSSRISCAEQKTL
jgi:hypothetical protein